MTASIEVVTPVATGVVKLETLTIPAANATLTTSSIAALTTTGVAVLSTAQTSNLTTTQLTALCANNDKIVTALTALGITL